ncbi:MAG: YbhB/YbcL family Raf kinase inhibitor-like protein [Actinomycetota bacterium]
MRPRPALLALIGLLVLAACDTGDGTTLRPPAEGAQAPLPATEVTISLPADQFAIGSTAFANQGLIPGRYTVRDGQNVSPPLAWGGPPEGTEELALVVTDVAESATVHWILAGLEPTSVGIDEGQVPPGAVQATTEFGSIGWTGPGSDDGTIHTFVFRLYALSEPIGLPDATPAEEMLARIDAVTINTTEFAGLFE